jgi:hypothetical protein
MIVPVPLCNECRYWHRENFEGFTCDAFPGGVPEAIIRSEHDHREPYPGDNGIRYEPVNGPSSPTPEANRG